MPLEYPDPELRSDLVHLREWGYADLPCIEAASADPRIPQGTTVPAEYTDEGGRAFIERQWSRQTSGRGLSLAIADAATGEAKGLVFLGLGPGRGHCDLGYWVVPEARRRGLGTDAVCLVSRWVLTETDVHRLAAQVVPDNTPSIGLLRSLGFSVEGRLRSWLWVEDDTVDVLQFSLLRSDLARSAS
jgi:RimJ/RimL family protein N-acetyltransferase